MFFVTQDFTYMHVHRELTESEKVLQNILFSCQFCMVFYVLKIGVFLPNFDCVLFSRMWVFFPTVDYVEKGRKKTYLIFAT